MVLDQIFGKNEPSIFTFTNRHDQEIGDHPQDYEPSGNDEDSVVELISGVYIVQMVSYGRRMNRGQTAS